MDFQWMTFPERPDLAVDVGPLHHQFPRFLVQGGPVTQQYWGDLYRYFPDFQFALSDAGGPVAACGHAIPLRWDGTVDDLPAGYDGALERGIADRQMERAPNTLCALAAITSPQHKRGGWSAQIIATMQAIAKGHALSTLIAPVRPTGKANYPLLTMERCVQWVRSDGSPFDPWLRVHWRLGGACLGVAQRSMTISGSVQEWETWTGMRFPASGPYVVPQAFNPVQIDVQTNCGLYISSLTCGFSMTYRRSSVSFPEDIFSQGYALMHQSLHIRGRMCRSACPTSTDGDCASRY